MSKDDEQNIKAIEMILRNNFGFELLITPDLLDVPLTSRPFCLIGSDLYRLMMCIEEKFGVYFSSQMIRNYGFGNIRDIIQQLNISNK